MILYPAIDLKGGACVRLVQGNMNTATVFNRDPAAQARQFVGLGFSWLHVVDLDGAFAGRSINGSVVRTIRAAVDVKIQLGGGIRDRAAIDYWLKLGIDRVVLGTAALREPDLVRRAAAAYPGRILVAIDSKNGRAAIEGWGQTSTLGTVELAQRFATSGVVGFVHTDIARDGALSGMNVAAIVQFAKQAGLPVIASGGIAGMADIEALAAHAPDGIAGAICGRALYDGRIDAAEALRIAAAAGPAQC